jgi:hypothetical protein
MAKQSETTILRPYYGVTVTELCAVTYCTCIKAPKVVNEKLLIEYWTPFSSATVAYQKPCIIKGLFAWDYHMKTLLE